MNDIMRWAQHWGVPQHMMTDLFNRLHPAHPASTPKGEHKSESYVSSVIEIESGEMGTRLWRNNVGATKTESGGFLRYGLSNESKEINAVLKSSDFIGVTPVEILPVHVGRTAGIFTAIEVKKTGWKYTGKGREVSQLNYINLVKSCGGFAGFVNGPGQFTKVVS